MRKIIFIGIIGVFIGCSEKSPKKTFRKKLKLKHTEICYGAYNRQYNEWYFLYSDNYIERVSLESYLRCEVGDSICWVE